MMTPALVSRRKALLLVLFLVGTAMTSGCRRRAAEVSEYKDPHPLPEEPKVVTVKTPGRYGGRFVLGQTGNPRTFNAMMANESSSADITNLTFSSLIDLDNETQQIEPGLAKSWEVAPDGVTWTFHLRKGAKFSDGHPMTAQDVLFSFQVALDPTVHPSVQDLLKMGGKFYDVSAPDDHTVVIKTPSPNAVALPTMGAVRIMPKHVLEGPFKAGSFAAAYNVSTPPDQVVSSGPWRVVQYVPGEKTVLGRNPYWYEIDQQKQRLPYLDEVIFLSVPDQDAADLKFRAGELHGLERVKPENYRWYTDNQQKGNFTLYDIGPDLNTNFLWFNLNTVKKAGGGKKVGAPLVDAVKYEWFRQPEFRRAVSMAIDRQAMIPSVFFGEGHKNWAIATPANKLWHSPDLVRYDYNPAEAKKLLAGLGFKDGNGDGMLEDPRGNPVSFTLKTNSDNTLRVGMGNFVKDDLAKVGIRVTLAPVEFNTLITNIRADFQYDAILMGLQSGSPPDPGMMQNLYRSSGITHFWNMAQPKPETPGEARIDALMDEIVSVQDPAARKRAYKEVETIINEQAWFIWLPIANQKLPVSNRFGNVQPSILAHRILWNVETFYFK
jgi:peptide/nickel transport system substrate-binding protein